MPELRYPIHKKDEMKSRKFTQFTCSKCECKQKVYWPLMPNWKCNNCGKANETRRFR